MEQFERKVEMSKKHEGENSQEALEMLNVTIFIDSEFHALSGKGEGFLREGERRRSRKKSIAIIDQG